MFAHVLKLSAFLLTIIISLVLALRASVSFDDDALRTLLPLHDACAANCWMGIEIGATRLDDARAILSAHEWVGVVYDNTIGLVWSWSGAQPALINDQQNGILRVEGGIARQMRVLTHARMGDFWLSFDSPNDALLVRPMTRYSAFQIAEYDALGVQVITSMRCPTEPRAFWMAASTIGMGEIWATETINGRSFNIYHTAGWWQRLRRC